MTPFALTDQVAIVTGSSRGLGRGIALVLAELGTDIVVNYRSARAEANEVVAQIQALGRRALPVQADVSDEADVQNWTITATANATAYGSSDTDGRKKRLAGTGDMTGSFTMLAVPSFEEGANAEFIGHTGNEVYTAQIFIETITPSVDIDNGTPSSWNVTFGGNGTFSHSSSA